MPKCSITELHPVPGYYLKMIVNGLKFMINLLSESLEGLDASNLIEN